MFNVDHQLICVRLPNISQRTFVEIRTLWEPRALSQLDIHRDFLVSQIHIVMEFQFAAGGLGSIKLRSRQ